MGLNYNQLPTEREWYLRGHTYFGSNSSISRCPTYGEMWANSDYCLGKYNGYWTGSWLSVGAVDSEGKAELTEDSEKCVKGTTTSKTTYQSWWGQITENVVGSSSADTIEFRYYYELNNSGNYNYIKCGSILFIYDTDGSQSDYTEIKINPSELYTGTESVTNSYLGIWCGNASGKQTWSYRLRKRGTDTWEDWVELGDAYSALVTTTKGSGVYGFLQAVHDYNGIQFYID